MRTSNLVALLLSGSLVAGCETSAPELEVPEEIPHEEVQEPTPDEVQEPAIDELKEQAAETTESAVEFAKAKKLEFEHKLDGLVEHLDERLAGLRQKIQEAGSEAESQWKETLANLQQLRDELQERITALKSQGYAAWEEMGKGVETSAEELRKTVEEAFSQFK